MGEIIRATGATITGEELISGKERRVVNGLNSDPVNNTRLINEAIKEGGTVEIPAGDWWIYTLEMKSDVNIYLGKDSILRAAPMDCDAPNFKQKGMGGSYLEPEVNPWVGLQDHGHTYFANSLIYGKDLENIMFYGEGTIIGSYTDEEGYTEYAIFGGDPFEPDDRLARGHRGDWFGNKGIALVDCRNIVFEGLSLVNLGHFAVITEGCENILVKDILIDTVRDALDIDCCRDVTVVNSRFNSLTDDGIVLKSSFGAGRYMPIFNILIMNVEVLGYDAGSVYAGTYTCDKVVANDHCGPTGRIKLGTEATCGYERVTIVNSKFNRCRGFALETCDGQPLKDIIFANCFMENVSSSPIYLRTGNRDRFPVTGIKNDTSFPSKDDVRLDQTNWVLPADKKFGIYPAKRYSPAYNFTKKVTVDGCSYFNIVDPDEPVRINENNFAEVDGKYFALKFDEESLSYIPDLNHELRKNECMFYGNAVGADDFAVIENVLIENVKVVDADPRYPIIIMGMTSSPCKNVTLKNVDVTYRGGLKMEHAVEQRQLNTLWEYSQWGSKKSMQPLPWLDNIFFVKNEGLLPRVKWDVEAMDYVEDPFNVPELSDKYPEPSNWGILPAYGIYARHVDGLHVENTSLNFVIEDERPAIVLDDVINAEFVHCNAVTAKDVPQLVTVTNSFKRPTGFEYVPGFPYHTTYCQVDTKNSSLSSIINERVTSPAPGTPADHIYGYPTTATKENGYEYKVKTDEYELPKTVYRPYFLMPKEVKAAVGEEICLEVVVRNPFTDGIQCDYNPDVWGEGIFQGDYIVACQKSDLKISVQNMPNGATYDENTRVFKWKVTESAEITFVADDDCIPVRHTICIVTGVA